jgi:hypothetical protein
MFIAIATQIIGHGSYSVPESSIVQEPVNE